MKQKDDEMDQNTFHCCYGQYVIINQKTKIKDAGVWYRIGLWLFKVS